MIKLIASDLDGTLAHADGSIPKETFSCVRELEEKGIQFVVATGRQGVDAANASPESALGCRCDSTGFCLVH